MASLKQKQPTGRKKNWTPEEDEKLTQAVAVHEGLSWTSLASKAGLNRSGNSCKIRWARYLRQNIKMRNMSDQEEDLILRLHKLHGNRWSLIAERLPGRTDYEIRNYWNTHLSKKIHQKEKLCTGDKKPSVASDNPEVHVEMKPECLLSQVTTGATVVKKDDEKLTMAPEKQEPTGREVFRKKWTPQEDKKLTEAIAAHGGHEWSSLASKAGLNRSGTLCRQRWVNFLRPDLKRGDMSDQEKNLIARLHDLHGNRWSLIAGKLPGRTANEIYNYWNTRLSKKNLEQEEKRHTNGANLTDEETSVADDDQEVHVEMNQDQCLSSQLGTSEAVIKKEVTINPEDCSSTKVDNVDVDDDFFNLLYEDPVFLKFLELQDARLLD